MQKEEVSILIVDDDAAMGKVMSEAVTRAGYKAMHLTKPDDALAYVKLQQVHAAVIDCMLPKMNGRDLAKKIRDELGPEVAIIFVSGIYKDKSFVKEAIQTVQAKAFLTKPFDIEAFLKTIDDSLGSLIDTPMSPLNVLLTKPESTHKERIKAINQTEQVHGFDLPMIYSFLMHPKIQGHLNMVSADGEVCGVGFDSTNIVQVNQEDARSYFGVLMVESGFISQQELDSVLNNKEKTKLKIGERLVAANVVSPHAISIVMAEQQGIRLSRTVGNTSVKVNFIETDEIRENATIDRTAFTELMNEWMMSKLHLDWLKSFYLPWIQFNLKKGPDYSPTHRVFTTPSVQKVHGVIEDLLRAETLEQVTVKYADKEDIFYRALHALVVSRVVRFGEAATSRDYGAQQARLVKLVQKLETQTHFERLGLSNKAKDSEIKRSFHEFAKILHPDKLPPGAPADVRLLTQRAFEMINTAHATLSDPRAKENYLIEVERGRADQILAAEQFLEQVPPLLSKGDISKARELIEAAIKLAPPTSDTRLLHMWARLKTPGIDKDQKSLEELREEIAKIPPEDRHNMSYLFVKALLLRVSGDFDGAKRSLEHCVSMYPESIDARRELATLNNSKKDVNLLNGDLKDVVGMLFKKKK
jgi:CheY-like chemotaxis protein/tetratricopeptide (TPR) repeat protein